MPRLRRIQKAYEARSRLLSLTITTAELTAAATSQTFSMGSIPTGGRIIGTEVRVTTALSGGSSTSATVDVGTSGDPNLVVAAADVFTGAAAKNNGNPGVDPVGTHSDEAIEMTVSSNVNVSAITAGEIEVDVVIDLPTVD